MGNQRKCNVYKYIAVKKKFLYPQVVQYLVKSLTCSV